jgi:hypothetical protein
MGQIGKPGPAGNFPREFEVCPECGKKGVYMRNWSFHIGMKEKLCKYCDYRAAPFLNGEPADPAKEFAELRRAIHELNTLVIAFCERWDIPVYGGSTNIFAEDAMRGPPPVVCQNAGQNVRPAEEKARLLKL